MVLSTGLLPAAFAEDADPYADYIYLTANDTYNNNSWNNTDAATFKQGHWSEAFDPARNYYVPADKTFYADAQGKDGGTWAGGELVIAGTMVANVNRKFSYAPNIPNLVFLGGSELRSSAYGLLNSPTRMTVLAPADDPLVIQMAYSKGGYPSQLYATICGDPGTGIRIEATSGATANGFQFSTGTFTNFYGTLTVTGEKVNVFRPNSNSYWFSMPGKLVVTDSAVFMPSHSEASTSHENVLVGALEVTDGGTVNFRERGDAAYVTLGITNSLKVADGGVVRVSNIDNDDLIARAKSGAGADRRVAVRIANLTGDAALAPDIDGAKVTMVNTFYDEAFDWKLFTQDGADGSKDVYAGVTNMATTVRNVDGGASPTNPDCWAGGVLPKEGNDFYLAYRFNPFKDWDFTQSKLIFDGTSSHYWTGTSSKDLNAKAYYVLGSCSFAMWGGASYNRRWRGGPTKIADGATLSFAAQDNCPQLRIESEIVGNGSLSFDTYHGGSHRYRMTLENINTNWHGRLTIRGFLDSGYTYNTILGDARNWGGEFLADANTYSAVTLASNTCVYVTNNVCFKDPTRGFYLLKAPSFMVKEGFTLTLSNQVTYAGVVTKKDAGTLELGGTARFMDGQAETAPVVTSNELVVAAGALKVSSKEACDGLAVSFAEGTKLVIPAGSADGLYDVKWDAPLASSAADGKVAVEIDTTGVELPELGFTTTIATLNATAAENVPADFFKVAKVPGYKMTGIVKRTTENGVAYDAPFEKQGLMVIIK